MKMDKNISGALPLLSSVFLIFFQTQLMRFQILDMNTDFQKQTHLGAILIQLLSNRMVKCYINSNNYWIFYFYPLTFIWTYTDVVSIERE